MYNNKMNKTYKVVSGNHILSAGTLNTLIPSPSSSQEKRESVHTFKKKKKCLKGTIFTKETYISKPNVCLHYILLFVLFKIKSYILTRLDKYDKTYKFNIKDGDAKLDRGVFRIVVCLVSEE
jgi:hypothetical protein